MSKNFLFNQNLLLHHSHQHLGLLKDEDLKLLLQNVVSILSKILL